MTVHSPKMRQNLTDGTTTYSDPFMICYNYHRQTYASVSCINKNCQLWEKHSRTDLVILQNRLKQDRRNGKHDQVPRELANVLEKTIVDEEELRKIGNSRTL